MEFRISQPLTPDFQRRAQALYKKRAAARQTPAPKPGVWMYLIAVVIATGILVGIEFLPPDVMITMALILLGAIVGALLMLFWLMKHGRRQQQKVFTQVAEQHFVFREAGVEISIPTCTAQYPWSAFEEIVHDDELLLLIYGLDKSAFGLEMRFVSAELLSLLQSKIPVATRSAANR